MKKLSILLLAVFFIGITNISAQADITTEAVIAIEEVQTEDVVKTECTKEQREACKKDASKCCKNKRKSSCSKSKGGSFNFNKTNNYGGEKSSCSKKAKKGCCKKKAKKCGADCTKPCCVPPPTIEMEVEPTEEAAPENK